MELMRDAEYPGIPCLQDIRQKRLLKWVDL